MLIRTMTELESQGRVICHLPREVIGGTLAHQI